jgi:GTP-binding protein
MPFSVAIVGRPNVGKSTLFNRLVGKKLALVDDKPGVTRDLREGKARLGDLKFDIIDTAGLENVNDTSLPGRIWQTFVFLLLMPELVSYLQIIFLRIF